MLLDGLGRAQKAPTFGPQIPPNTAKYRSIGPKTPSGHFLSRICIGIFVVARTPSGHSLSWICVGDILIFNEMFTSVFRHPAAPARGPIFVTD